MALDGYQTCMTIDHGLPSTPCRTTPSHEYASECLGKTDPLKLQLEGNPARSAHAGPRSFPLPPLLFSPFVCAGHSRSSDYPSHLSAIVFLPRLLAYCLSQIYLIRPIHANRAIGYRYLSGTFMFPGPTCGWSPSEVSMSIGAHHSVLV